MESGISNTSVTVLIVTYQTSRIDDRVSLIRESCENALKHYGYYAVIPLPL